MKFVTILEDRHVANTVSRDNNTLVSIKIAATVLRISGKCNRISYERAFATVADGIVPVGGGYADSDDGFNANERKNYMICTPIIVYPTRY